MLTPLCVCYKQLFANMLGIFLWRQDVTAIYSKCGMKDITKNFKALSEIFLYHLKHSLMQSQVQYIYTSHLKV